MSALRDWVRREVRRARSTYSKEENPGIPKGLPILPESHHDLCFDPLPSLSPFFQKLPLEIRRAIYLSAFGNQTLHVDLQYRHPYIPGRCHTGLVGNSDAFDKSTAKAWLWWSCVCHRCQFYPDDLYLDSCNFGVGHCDERLKDDGSYVDERGPGCYVGVMGRMTSCRQA